MEPVTHVLTGACLARTGLNRRAAYATAAMAVAAEFPDADTVWTLRGPVSGFEHHRGITHTFLGVPFEAAFLLLVFYGVHRLRVRKQAQPQASQSLGSSKQTLERTLAPVRWGSLYLLILLALLSHILLDYTNNYGVRPFFPFNAHWYAGSFVFIFDPLLFFILVAGLVLPAIFGWIGKEVGATRDRFRGRGWARAAIVGVLLLWALRSFEHDRATTLAQNQTLRAPAADETVQAPVTESEDAATPAPEVQRPLLSAQRSLASPDPLSVFRWYTATDFGAATRLGIADTRVESFVPGAIFAQKTGPGLRAAEGSLLGRAYLDWSPLPILSAAGDTPEGADLDPGSKSSTTITFSDPRFMGDTLLLKQGGLPPLTGQVVLDATGKVIAEGMDGRFGR